MSRKALENTNEMCSCPPWESYNTLSIELIQYGRRISKKVYAFSLKILSNLLRIFLELKCHVSVLLKCMYSQLYDMLENMKLRHALEKKKKE